MGIDLAAPLGDWQTNTEVLSMTLPDGVTARVKLPASKDSSGVYVDGKQVRTDRVGARWLLADDITATRQIEVK